MPAAKDLMASLCQLDIKATDQAKHSWNIKRSNRNIRLHQFIPSIDAQLSVLHLQRRFWARLYRLRTGVGRFPLFSTQLEYGNNCTQLANESRRLNGRPHNNRLSTLLSILQYIWTDPIGLKWRYNQLAARNLPRHLTRSSNDRTNQQHI